MYKTNVHMYYIILWGLFVQYTRMYVYRVTGETYRTEIWLNVDISVMLQDRVLLSCLFNLYVDVL